MQPSDEQASDSAAGGSAFPTTVQSAIAENERIVEAMDSILQCPCSQDVYLLTVLSLVVFKVLDRYAAAARAAPTVTPALSLPTTNGYNKLNIPSSPYPSLPQKHSLARLPGSTSNSSSLCIDRDEDSGRVAAQMILSELHRAQRLVNELSARFKAHRMSGTETGSAPRSTLPNDPMEDVLCDGGGGPTRPFSNTMLDQLEADLRARLRGVSLKILEMIRRL